MSCIIRGSNPLSQPHHALALFVHNYDSEHTQSRIRSTYRVQILVAYEMHGPPKKAIINRSKRRIDRER